MIQMNRVCAAMVLSGLFMVVPVRAQLLELPVGAHVSVEAYTLTGLDGSPVPLKAVLGERATVLLFWSNECPWSRKYEGRVAAWAGTFASQGVSFVLVNAADPVAYPKEAPAESRGHYPGREEGVRYLYDPAGTLAHAVGAQRAPQAFVLDESHTLVYVGAPDDSPGNEDKVRRSYLADVLAALLSGETPAQKRTKAFGCRIKFAGRG